MWIFDLDEARREEALGKENYGRVVGAGVEC